MRALKSVQLNYLALKVFLTICLLSTIGIHNSLEAFGSETVMCSVIDSSGATASNEDYSLEYVIESALLRATANVCNTICPINEFECPDGTHPSDPVSNCLEIVQQDCEADTAAADFESWKTACYLALEYLFDPDPVPQEMIDECDDGPDDSYFETNWAICEVGGFVATTYECIADENEPVGGKGGLPGSASNPGR